MASKLFAFTALLIILLSITDGQVDYIFLHLTHFIGVYLGLFFGGGKWNNGLDNYSWLIMAF